MDRELIKAVLKDVVNLLVEKQYETLYVNDVNKRLSVEELEFAIERYGEKLSVPPDEAFNNFNVYKEDDEFEQIVEFDLWTEGEKSDLTLSLIVLNMNGHYRFAIDDIHVL